MSLFLKYNWLYGCVSFWCPAWFHVSIYFKMIPPRAASLGVYYVNELDGVGKTLFALVSQGNQGHRWGLPQLVTEPQGNPSGWQTLDERRESALGHLGQEWNNLKEKNLPWCTGILQQVTLTGEITVTCQSRHLACCVSLWSEAVYSEWQQQSSALCYGECWWHTGGSLGRERNDAEHTRGRSPQLWQSGDI